MEQVLAERAGLDPLLEILVRRGDHAHVAAHRVVAADAIELAVGEDAQQARLQVERHVADLVEEERAAVGLLEAAAPRRLRAGERAALVAEQLGFEQVLRDRRGVDRDERPRGARAVLVQRVGDELLARARLAGDEHGDDALAEAADGAEHVLHGRRLAEDLRDLRHGRLDLSLVQALLDGAPDQVDRLGHVEGLGQVVEGAALEGADRAVEVRVGGHDDDRQVAMPRLDLREQLDARASGHADVGDEHLRLLVLERREHVARVREAADGELLARQRLLEHEADRLVVVDDPDGLHAIGGAAGVDKGGVRESHVR
jgi:hypothetical protein